MNKSTYTITSSRFTGHISISFTDMYCTAYNTQEANLSVKQQQYMFNILHMPEDDFLNELKTAGVFTITGGATQITFIMFWNRYNEKALSSKKKAMARWQRMSQQQQQLAYHFITQYLKSIPTGIAKKYAETYLNSEIWNN